MRGTKRCWRASTRTLPDLCVALDMVATLRTRSDVACRHCQRRRRHCRSAPARPGDSGVWPGLVAVLRTVSHNAGTTEARSLSAASEVAALLASHPNRRSCPRRVAVLPRLPADTAISAVSTDRLRRLRALTAEETIIDSSLYTTSVAVSTSPQWRRVSGLRRSRRLRAGHEVAFESMTGGFRSRARSFSHLRARWSGRRATLQGLLSKPELEAFLVDALTRSINVGGHGS